MYLYLYGPRPGFLAPLSWVLTFQVFAISAIWYIWVSQVPLILGSIDGPPDFSRGTAQTIPLNISLDIYERHVRAIFPWLPSIRQKLLSLRTAVLAFFPEPPSESGTASSAAGSRSHRSSRSTNTSASPLPTLDVDMDAIRAGGS